MDKTKNRKKGVEDTVAQYFREVGDALDECTGDEERQALADNALYEVRENAPAVLGNARLSRTVEKLLDRASGAGRIQLAESLGGKGFLRSAKSPWGSYALENLLISLAEGLREEGLSAERVSHALTPIVEMAAQTAHELAKSSAGSHALRSLIAFVSGDPQAASSASGDAKKGLAHPQPFDSHLSEFARKIAVDSPARAIHKLAFEASGSAFLQSLLRGVAQSRLEGELFNQLMAKSMGAQPQGDRDIHLAREVSRKRWIKLSKDEAGSHLIEAFLFLCSLSASQELYDKVFQGLLGRLAMHKQANFVVQRLVRKLSDDKSRLVTVLRELRNELGPLVQNSRAGVVCALVESLRSYSKQHSWASLLLFAQLQHLDDEPLRSLLFHGGVGEVNAQGCRACVALGSSSKTERKRWWKRFRNLNGREVAALVKSPPGALLAENFMTSTLPSDWKVDLVRSLRGSFAEVAATGPGSSVLEKSRPFLEVDDLKSIAEELSNDEKRLAKTKFGAMLLRRMDIATYKKDKGRWSEQVRSRTSKRRLFDDLFQDEPSKAHRTMEPLHPHLITSVANFGKSV